MDLKKAYDFLMGSLREILQIFCLILCIVLPPLIDAASHLNIILHDTNLTEGNNMIYYALMKLGNWAIGLALAICVRSKCIMKKNKDKTINKGQRYHNKPYWWFWVCSKVLGYKKCNLVGVPIYTQCRLVIRDTFEEYPFNYNYFPQQDSEVEVKYKNKNEVLSRKHITLIIEDTYPIYDEQIPQKYREYYTIIVSRLRNYSGERVYSKKLVENVNEVIRELNVELNEITLNIFSTTNPKHTYEIMREAVPQGQRGNVKHINVFQQRDDKDRKFNSNIYKVI
ncbi:hypothetical protein [uncultured Abiotrophia sp.]|uniref:hypothetical protein n=1 Tax=uncultured Abiotrophia sp. TaxID=316094 RepID=UPI00288B725D|nr:hypothetical protein [uncultured Abiotrophia sp.]